VPGHLRRIAYETNVGLRLPPGADRRRLLADYLRLKARQVRGASGPGTARLLDWEIRYFDLATFAFVVEEIFLERIYELDLPDEPRILDCGANIGLASLFFAWRHPGARISAFEPGPATFEVLRANLDAAGVDADLRQVAVSDRAGEVLLYNPGGAGSVGSSVVTSRRADAPSDRVKAITLSSAVDERIDLLKLDVEGAEHQVLRELVDSGAIDQIDHIISDVNHHLVHGDELGRTLVLLEEAGFGYQISAPLPTPFQRDVAQDVILFAYRR
jgi:FkbM family methyltransferase